MRRAVLAAVLTVAAATTTASATHGPVVHASGRIGPFRIDETTELRLRAVAGRPVRVQTEFWPGRRDPVGRTLYYRCGRGCRTSFSFNDATGRLSDFWTESPHYRTARGSRVGMTRAQAVRRERKGVLRGCGIGGPGGHIYVRTGPGPIFVLTVHRRRVVSMTYLGRHSVYYEGLC